jgi:hypothetical protein
MADYYGQECSIEISPTVEEFIKVIEQMISIAGWRISGLASGIDQYCRLFELQED